MISGVGAGWSRAGSGTASIPETDTDRLVKCGRAFDHCTIDRDAATAALATCNAALGSCQGAQSNGAAVLALGTAGGVAAVTGGFLVGQKHVEVGLGVLGVGLLLELAGLHEAGVIRFP